MKLSQRIILLTIALVAQEIATYQSVQTAGCWSGNGGGLGTGAIFVSGQHNDPWLATGYDRQFCDGQRLSQDFDEGCSMGT